MLYMLFFHVMSATLLGFILIHADSQNLKQKLADELFGNTSIELPRLKSFTIYYILSTGAAGVCSGLPLSGWLVNTTEAQESSTNISHFDRH